MFFFSRSAWTLLFRFRRKNKMSHVYTRLLLIFIGLTTMAMLTMKLESENVQSEMRVEILLPPDSPTLDTHLSRQTWYTALVAMATAAVPSQHDTNHTSSSSAYPAPHHDFPSGSPALALAVNSCSAPPSPYYRTRTRMDSAPNARSSTRYLP